VLDCSTAQLARLKTLAPAGESSKIDAHAQAIRRVEEQLRMMIDNMSMPPTTGTCAPPLMPDMSLVGQNSKVNRDYKNPGSGPTTSSTDDSTLHANIGKAHMAIIRTAFQCDVLRVATFQWSPGTNHVSFKGQFPGDPNGIYMYHPTSHQIVNSSYSTSSPSGASATEQNILGFLANCQTWYNQRMAEFFAEWKATTDVYGNNLLAHTIIPYITEVSEPYHMDVAEQPQTQRSVADDRAGLLQDHEPDRHDPDGQRRRHHEHLRPQRGVADHRPVEGAVTL
jgi:hypothetical protein